MTPVPPLTQAPSAPLVARPVAFDAIPREAWQRLQGLSPAATPFSGWTFHRAWWDAYGTTAHEQYLVCTRADDADGSPEAAAIVAIIPLMHRHAVEPQDAATATHLRGHHAAEGTTVPPTSKVVFFGASYHADYATILAAPDDLPAASQALVQALLSPDTSHGDQAWDAVDLRRLRDIDPARVALEQAFERAATEHGWSLCREQEDVCPVVTFPGDDWEAFLGTLGKKDRHEVRRKVRRLEGAGEVTFEHVEPTPDAIDRFIELHQARWGAEGLFPDTEGGARSRRFVHRLAELETASPPEDRCLQLGSLSVDGRPIFSAMGFDDGTSCYFYNAGMDPNARELSPGVTGAAAYLRDRIEAGRHRFDFLRGDEAYKYEWGAVDEPIHRLLLARTNDA